MMNDARKPLGQPEAVSPPGKLAYATPTTAPHGVGTDPDHRAETPDGQCSPARTNGRGDPSTEVRAARPRAAVRRAAAPQRAARAGPSGPCRDCPGRRRLHLRCRHAPSQLRDLPERVGEPLACLVTVLLRAQQLGGEVAELGLETFEVGHRGVPVKRERPAGFRETSSR